MEERSRGEKWRREVEERSGGKKWKREVEVRYAYLQRIVVVKWQNRKSP